MFFKERRDTSEEVIAESMAFLNRKPKRQGSNQQWIDEAVTSAKTFSDFLSSNPMNKNKKATYFSPYNKNVSSDDIHQGLSHPEAIRKAINHPNAQPEHFDKVLAGDYNEHIKRDIINHPNATEEQKQRARKVKIKQREETPDNRKYSPGEMAQISRAYGPGSKNVKPVGY